MGSINLNFMLKFLKAHALPVSVFITGACVLIVEVVATRVLSPYFGSTIFTVSSVISVVLAALSVGYYAGGKFADKHPSLKYFYGIIMISGLVLLLFHLLGLMVLPLLGDALPITTGPLLAAVALFLLPALLLGTLSPYAVKLQSLQAPKQGVGTAAGSMFFWSTLGSISGSLLAGFVFIPYVGVNQIIIATSVVLFLLGLVPLVLLGIPRDRVRLSVLILAVTLAGAVGFGHASDHPAVYRKDGVYEKLTVYDGWEQGRPVRYFQQDRSSSGAMFMDTDDPRDVPYEYTKYYSLYKLFKPDTKSALVIGGGAYTIPKALLADLPAAKVDVSEIEPSLFGLARRYFGLKATPRLHNYTVDGRRFLHDTPKTYDFIFSDVYYSLYSIPPHFTTQEFFRTARTRLTPGGFFAANLIGDLSRQKPSLVMSELKTFQSVFPNSYVFATRSPGQTGVQNIILVGYNDDKKVDLNPASLARYTEPILRQLADKRVDLERFDLSSYPTLTDNFSPVEYLTAKTLRKSGAAPKALSGEEMLALIKQQVRYGSRSVDTPGHERIQKFLKAELSTLTDHVVVQAWEHTGSDSRPYALRNIIGRFYPERPRRIILGTHYDTKKLADRDRSQPKQPVPGANDAASGTAVLLEVARALSRQAPANVGVDVVFFDGEEGEPQQGSDYSHWQPLGSTYFAQHLPDIYGGAKPEDAIVLDMVCDKDLRLFKEASSTKAARGQTDRLWAIGRQLDPRVFRAQGIPEIMDDHSPLNKAGIPSTLVIDLDYPPFHTTSDTPDKCSAQSLETVARATLDFTEYSR